ncbi:uncharacterized protein LOC128347771 [Hemicordylus capensis]|uniref:uncharacterized protein LOC128347771 n=1 Tax=Hemicordylus capensis TaxID=884348 RepID=UPI0023036B97|nr:uncharacterized protein LOC128347771 [Hemicordylus capensis]
MALADFHYTTGISSGFKVYILEGQPSFENEHKFHRLPAHRLPVYSIKRKLTADIRSPDHSLEGQKVSKIRRSAYGPVAVSLEQMALPPAPKPDVPVAASCVATSRPEPSRDSRALHPSCPQKCPLRKPLLGPALSLSHLQQMRPSVITCAPRRSCPEAPTNTSHPQMLPLKHKNNLTPDSPHSQRLHAWTTSAARPAAQLSGEASPKQIRDTADKNPYPSP